MILLDLQTKHGRSLLVFDNLTGIEYDEASGELSFVGESVAKPVYLDKKTPATDVWALIHKSLSNLYEGRATHVLGYLVVLDVTRFQTEATTF